MVLSHILAKTFGLTFC